MNMQCLSAKSLCIIIRAPIVVQFLVGLWVPGIGISLLCTSLVNNVAVSTEPTNKQRLLS